ncbi:MAG TPA: DUF4166 domain-containing protein [Steroidobacteraceae bacterium]|nr:DUF4166 domain-containing protein [Steroidobacteraceae bacterium]
MSATDAARRPSFTKVQYAAHPGACRARHGVGRPGLRDVLGESAWRRLPEPVRARFGDAHLTVDYAGTFEIVRANPLGRLIARACRLIGTPVAPHTGANVPAMVHVAPSGAGVEWRREYRWSDRPPSIVRSTKVVGPDCALVEELPAHLYMPLDVYEQEHALHFVSRSYYFAIRLPLIGQLKLALPTWLSPGITHVVHTDQGHGWFRFTMIVTHPAFGELFYQTGLFRASGGSRCLPRSF